MIDITKLKELAEETFRETPEYDAMRGLTAFERLFATAASPAAVLELIAEIEYLQLEMSGVERAKQDLAVKLGCADEPRWKWLLWGADDLIKERDQLKAENEALRRDAERWRWWARKYEGRLESEVDALMSKEASHD